MTSGTCSWTSIASRIPNISDEEMDEIWEDHAKEVVPLLQEYQRRILLASNTERNNRSDEERQELKRLLASVRKCLQVCMFLVSRPKFQQKATSENWQTILFTMICQSRTDMRTRKLCTRVLSNLVTENAASANALVECIAVSPSEESIRQSIEDSTLRDDVEGIKGRYTEPTWVDGLLCAAKSGDRQCLADYAVFILNFLVSSLECETFSDITFAKDKIFISCLLRHALAVDTSKQSIESTHDEATEMIGSVLAKLVERGVIQQMYTSAGSDDIAQVYPEQLILLNLIYAEFETRKSKATIPVDSVETTTRFLCQLALSNSRRENEDSDLSKEAHVLAIEILSELTAGDSMSAARVRECVGEQSTVLQDQCEDIASLIDSLAQRNENTATRDLKVEPIEQRELVAFVRLVGNICYLCKTNQDLLRHISVPTKEGNERTGIHVLLSTTAYAQACFTLREWAVIAVRNVLENNDENKSLVAQLEAKQPIQSAALQSLGVQVELDHKGQVSVKPM